MRYLFEVSEAKVYTIAEAQDAIFMVFTLKKRKTEKLIEIQREMVKIKWVGQYEENTKAYQREKKNYDKARIHEAKRELRLKQRQKAKEEKAI